VTLQIVPDYLRWCEYIPALASSGLSTLRREVFRAQIGSGTGKEIRWQAEKALGEQVTNQYVSRNQLLNEGVGIYQEQNTDRTDILHDAAIACGGRYYLPYRLHATKDQMVKAYPQATAFFERKRHYDPEEIFQNQFYIKYGRP